MTRHWISTAQSQCRRENQKILCILPNNLGVRTHILLVFIDIVQSQKKAKEMKGGASFHLRDIRRI